MLKKLTYLLIAGLAAITLFSCSNGQDTNTGIPQIKEIFYTEDLSKALDPSLSSMKRLDTIKVNHTSSKTFDFPYSLVVAFYDEDIDVIEMHLSWDDFDTNDDTYIITQKWTNQYSWYDNCSWKIPERINSLTLTAYLVDSLGNKSEKKTFTVNTVFGD